MGRLVDPVYDEAVRQLQLARESDDPRIHEMARAQFARARVVSLEVTDDKALRDTYRHGSPAAKVQALLAMEGARRPPTKVIETRVVSISRNEPCPCGSGLKFKWCCES